MNDVTVPCVLLNEPGHLLRVLHDLGDAEVEELDGVVVAPRVPDDEMLAGLTSRWAMPRLWASASASATGLRSSTASSMVRGRHPLRRSLCMTASSVRPVEPLEHHVRHPIAGGGGEGPDVTGLDDGGGALREVREERTLLDEVAEEALPLVDGEGGHRA